MPIINCRLAPLIHQRFHEVCEERGVTASDVLRKAVEAFIDRVDDNAAEIRAATSDVLLRGLGVTKVTPDGRVTRIAPESIYLDARTGEALPPRKPYQKQGKTK